MIRFYAIFQGGADDVRVPAGRFRIVYEAAAQRVEATLPGLGSADAVAAAYDGGHELVISYQQGGGVVNEIARVPVQDVDYNRNLNSPKINISGSAAVVSWVPPEPLGMIGLDEESTSGILGAAVWRCRNVAYAIRAGIVPGTEIGHQGRVIIAGDIDLSFIMTQGSGVDMSMTITEAEA